METTGSDLVQRKHPASLFSSLKRQVCHFLIHLRLTGMSLTITRSTENSRFRILGEQHWRQRSFTRNSATPAQRANFFRKHSRPITKGSSLTFRTLHVG